MISIYSTTLSKQEIRSGFAEVIKHALIYDPIFYQLVAYKYT